MIDDDTTTTMRAAGDTAASHGEAGAGWEQGGTALVMLASVLAYGVMASGCAGV